MKNTHNIELLAPAGSPEALDAAVGEGADAVYLGLKDFNARLRSANFTYAQFESALRSLRRMGKKVYVTVNTVFEQREADRMYQFLKYLSGQGADALIVQDFGVIAMARAEFPSLKLHASTQMNIASARGANALSRHGVSRVVLSRELSIDELHSIKKETNLELEVFAHGALCISFSGLCLFSSFLGGKSANRGMCTQACRRLYKKISSSREEESGYYFSPGDLQLLEKVPNLASAGISSLKIEGRMKSASYTGAVVSAYRLVLDAVAGGDENEILQSIKRGQEILHNDFARPKTQYFFEKEARANVNWLNPNQDGGTGISLGLISKVKGSKEERRVLIFPPKEVVLQARDSVRIHHSNDAWRISQKLKFVKADGEGRSAGIWISAPQGEVGDSVYLIQTKEMSKRYKPVISGKLSSKGPGRDKAPFPLVSPAVNKFLFPEGLYVAVSRTEDLYILQSSRPVQVILTLSQKNIRRLAALNEPPLPFKAAEIILALDPWFPQELAVYENGKLAEQIEILVERGYTQYMVNNPGHFSLFRNFDNIKLLAGPWLYIFNSWSLSFVSSLRADAFVSPLENNRQNLEKTLGIKSKSANNEGKGREKRRKAGFMQSKFFIPVFAYPPLFSIKANLKPVLGINAFADNKDEKFSLVTELDGCRVYPQKAFSIIDKIPFLKEAGFARFIIDLCGYELKKSNYRDLMTAVKENITGSLHPLPNASRFNWKNGFYAP